MSLTKTEKINILMGLSAPHKEKIIKAILNAEKKGMSGTGVMDAVKGLGQGLLEVLKVVGPILAKEVLLPIVKSKMSGNGLKLAGQRGKGTSLAGGCCETPAPSTGAPVNVKRGRGRPRKHPVM